MEMQRKEIKVTFSMWTPRSCKLVDKIFNSQQEYDDFVSEHTKDHSNGKIIGEQITNL